MKEPSMWTILFVAYAALTPGCLKSKDDAPPVTPPIQNPAQRYDWPKIADTAITALNSYFWHAGDQYFVQDNQGNTNFNYWWNAHAIDALVDAYLRKSDGAVSAEIGALHDGIKKKNNGAYINDYYDDMEWLALACLRAYEATTEEKYKQTALALWENIKLGWNSEAGGGIAWRKTQTNYKNTPANAPAVILAARLYALDKKTEDLEWAKKIYSWLVNTLVDASSGQVWDGINRQGNGAVDKDWKFTYNQGIFIGAGLELFLATHEQAYVNAALRTASFSIADPQLSPSGILKNEDQGDGGLFKGILVRYLTELIIKGNPDNDNKKKLIDFLSANAQSLWSKATVKPQALFSPDWTQQPGNAVDLSTQLSGIFLVESMARLKKEGLVK